MPLLTLQAHYDGQKIVLDEADDLPPNANLIVTVLPSTGSSPVADRDPSGLQPAPISDAFAFLRDPAEDIYTVADGEPFRDAL